MGITIEVEDMCRGDVVTGKNNTNTHYPEKGHSIVFLENFDEYSFVGLMLTTKSYKGMNVLMDSSHFVTHDVEGNEYDFKYKNTHVVPLNLLKKTEWKPFRKVGKLTPEGLLFVEEVIAGTEPVYWVDAVKANH